MSILRAFKQRLATVSRLRHEGDYDSALAEVESLLETWPGNAHLHVLKSKLVQLQEEPKYELDAARQALEQAIELDRNSPAAFVELGYFLDNVEDNPRAAVKAYTDGVSAARNLLIDGLIGQAKAYRQLERREEFLGCLLEVLQLARFDSGSKRNKTTGHFLGAQLEGPYVEQIQELLDELDGEISSPTQKSRKTGTGG